MSDKRQLTDVCFERVVDWLLTHANVSVVGDSHRFFNGIHGILALAIDEAAHRQRQRLLHAQPSAN